MMNFAMHMRLFLRSFFLQTGWNFVKYQNVGLTFIMLPFCASCINRIKKHCPQLLPDIWTILTRSRLWPLFA